MFATMARELAEVDGVRPTLQHLVTLAVTTVPCDWAAAVMAEQITPKPAPMSASSEPELFDEVARISGKAGSSPGWDAFDSGDMVHCPDLGTETRYPAYTDDMLRRTAISAYSPSTGVDRGRSTTTRSVELRCWPTTRPSRSTRRPAPTGPTTSRSRCSATGSPAQPSAFSSSGFGSRRPRPSTCCGS